MTAISGILNVAKPSGPTSRQVVDRVQKLVRPAKVGHAGTLDPLASGVLVACVGHATRLIEYVQRLPKTYEAAFLLGRTSDTEDTQGNVVLLETPPIPTRSMIEAAARSFLGTIQQRPPAFSALKVAGRRAYDLARKGQDVELTPRPVEVYEIELFAYEYPELHLRIRCGSGTYVRSLGRDLAESLGTGAIMSALTRTAIGNFTLAEAYDADHLTAEGILARLLPPRHAVEHLPTVTVSDDERRTLMQGRTIATSIARKFTTTAGDTLAALDASGNLVALLSHKGDRLTPTRNFA